MSVDDDDDLMNAILGMAEGGFGQGVASNCTDEYVPDLLDDLIGHQQGATPHDDASNCTRESVEVSGAGEGESDDEEPADVADATLERTFFGDVQSYEPGKKSFDAFLACGRLEHLRNRTLLVRLGTDCSGADAPYFAWQSIRRIAAIELNCTINIRHMFSSE